jgi:hypothetical protein
MNDLCELESYACGVFDEGVSMRCSERTNNVVGCNQMPGFIDPYYGSTE